MSASVRRDARMLAVQFLFQREFHPDDKDLDKALSFFFEETKAAKAAAEFARVLVRGVVAHQVESDEKLVLISENWDLKRIGIVERNILRLALFELNHRPDIPPVVTVNEAVVLAKELSSEESGKFVNGLLDRVMKTLDRPLRVSAGKASKKPAPRKE
jgi:N utilization substance protein B